tara:strand:- start:1428 stop:1616 length:189 start_codon:yes stop_codon:yes gene_type:complete
MLGKLNTVLIIGLSLSYAPLHTKEISKNKEYLSSSVEEIAEEMKNLNSNLELLSNTISNLVP